MAGIEEMHFGVRKITQVRMCTVFGEDLVVLAPDDQHRRLAFAEKGLKLRIERDIRAVIVEEIELDILVAGTVEQGLIVNPVVGADAGERSARSPVRDA